MDLIDGRLTRLILMTAMAGTIAIGCGRGGSSDVVRGLTPIAAGEQRSLTVSGDAVVRDVNSKLTTFGKVTKSLITGTDGGGEITGYQQTGKVRRLDLSVGLSNAMVNEVFYFDADENLVLVTRSRQSLPSVQAATASAPVGRSECYYIRNGLAVLAGSLNETAAPTGSSEEWGHLARQLVELLKSPDKEPDAEKLFR